jgi:hypothetical protein
MFTVHHPFEATSRLGSALEVVAQTAIKALNSDSLKARVGKSQSHGQVRSGQVYYSESAKI